MPFAFLSRSFTYDCVGELELLVSAVHPDLARVVAAPTPWVAESGTSAEQSHE